MEVRKNNNHSIVSREGSTYRLLPAKPANAYLMPGTAPSGKTLWQGLWQNTRSNSWRWPGCRSNNQITVERRPDWNMLHQGAYSSMTFTVSCSSWTKACVCLCLFVFVFVCVVVLNRYLVLHYFYSDTHPVHANPVLMISSSDNTNSLDNIYTKYMTSKNKSTCIRIFSNDEYYNSVCDPDDNQKYASIQVLYPVKKERKKNNNTFIVTEKKRAEPGQK